MVKKGQVALYLIFALVTIAILTLLNVDTFIVYRTKMQVENAGDAASLAAARHQGELLNEIGRLNIEHIVELLDADPDRRTHDGRIEEIELTQRRLALIGPVKALHYADLAARANGMEPREDFAEILKMHARDVRDIYAASGETSWDPYPPSYGENSESNVRNAWLEYADAIDEVVADGLACGPDNIEFYHAASGHLLLNRQFYYAIKGETWCWFHFNCEDFFNVYTNYHDWGRMPMPRSIAAHTENSEIFSLHLRVQRCALTDLMTTNELAEAIKWLSELEPSPFSDVMKLRIDRLGRQWLLGTEEERSEILERLEDPDHCWFTYETSSWREWTDFQEYGLPMLGPIKSEYDVRGCSAICRVIKNAMSSALGSSQSINWCAAAKPFGCGVPMVGNEDPDGEPVVCTRILRNLVTPCFTAARLVAIDSVGGRDLTTADASWVYHVRRHLGNYLAYGRYHANCGWCDLLRRWDNFWWHERGRIWLQLHAGECEEWGGGGGGPGPSEDSGGGGTAHGH